MTKFFISQPMNGKTEEEMLADVKTKDDAFIAAMQNYEEYCREQGIEEGL